jgi:NADH:ubiquinone oxidoreductase subunit B-like Fe-S oxidoreductase
MNTAPVQIWVPGYMPGEEAYLIAIRLVGRQAVHERERVAGVWVRA